MNLLKLSERIRALRLVKGLTLEQVANRACATRSYLSKVENFRITPSLPSLGQIAVALDTSMAELVVDLDSRQNLSIIRSDERKLVDRDRPATSSAKRRRQENEQYRAERRR